MELKDLLGEELFAQVDSKVQEHNGTVTDKNKHVKLVDLSDGGYVSKDKYSNLQTEAGTYKTQLGEANNAIQSYKEMDIEGIKKAADEWKVKYETDTAALQTKLAETEKTFAAEKYLDGQKIKSPLSKKTILNEFMAQGFEFKDGAFAGADDYMKKVREQYPDEFIPEENKPEEKKTWVRGTSNTFKPKTSSEQEAHLKSKYQNNKYYRG